MNGKHFEKRMMEWSKKLHTGHEVNTIDGRGKVVRVNKCSVRVAFDNGMIGTYSLPESPRWTPLSGALPRNAKVVYS